MSASDSKLPIQIFAGKTSEIIVICDCSLMKSGSVSLEMMGRGKPAAVMYHVSRLTYAIGKMLVRIPYFSLPNLMAKEVVLPEFLSYGACDSKSAKQSIASTTKRIAKTHLGFRISIEPTSQATIASVTVRQAWSFTSDRAGTVMRLSQRASTLTLKGEDGTLPERLRPYEFFQYPTSCIDSMMYGCLLLIRHAQSANNASRTRSGYGSWDHRFRG